MRLFMLRHPKASPPVDETYESDLARPLSEIGEAQAQTRLKALGNVKFKLVLSSPAVRCIKLAGVLAGGEDWVTVHHSLVPPAPGDGGIGDAIDAQFKELGYAPLRTYLRKSDAMYWFGTRAADSIRGLLLCLNFLPGTNILLTNHAICTEAIILGFLPKNSPFRERVLESVLGETEGFVLHLNKDVRVTNIEDIR